MSLLLVYNLRYKCGVPSYTQAMEWAVLDRFVKIEQILSPTQHA